MDIRRTLKELGDLAVTETGFCVGIYWRSVTGRSIPKGMISPNYRLAYILFTGFDPAYRFHALLTCKGIARLPRQYMRLVQIDHAGVIISGVAVIAVIGPDCRHASGFRPAPAYEQQPGYQRYFRQLALDHAATRPWWEHELGDCFNTDCSQAPDLSSLPNFAERQADEALEHILDRLEAEYDDKLWWYGTPGRRSIYPPALGSVHDLVAYARKQELDPEEFARRNRDRQVDQWLHAQRQREQQRQQELDADQAEIAAALSTPRRGRNYAADRDWLETEALLRARKAMKHVYRDTTPRRRRLQQI